MFEALSDPLILSVIEKYGRLTMVDNRYQIFAATDEVNTLTSRVPLRAVQIYSRNVEPTAGLVEAAREKYGRVLTREYAKTVLAQTNLPSSPEAFTAWGLEYLGADQHSWQNEFTWLFTFQPWALRVQKSRAWGPEALPCP